MNSRGYRQQEGPTGLMAGVTTLELFVALLIAGILLTVAVPSYQRYVQRIHRADAVRALLEAAACQERNRAAFGHYDTTRCSPLEDNAAYVFRIEPENDDETLEFTVVADPRGEPADDPCGSLSLDQSGRRGTSGPQTAVAACWGGR